MAERTRIGRRALLGASLLPLAGCGFRPLYGSAPGGGPGIAQAEFPAIDVGIIPNRSGQLLRQALQSRLAGSGAVTIAKRYRLTATFAVLSDTIGLQPDNTATRIRLSASAVWTLDANDPTHTRLTGGTARALDGLNVINSQYFAADMETDAVTGRLADAVADQITMQIGTYFQRVETAAKPA